jgi:hypothetical protein
MKRESSLGAALVFGALVFGGGAVLIFVALVFVRAAAAELVFFTAGYLGHFGGQHF